MHYYTFRLVSPSWYRHKEFECCKWSDTEREPIDVYTIKCFTRSHSCSCYARGQCKHISCVEEILANGLEHDMHHYIWSYEDTWQEINDMELENP